MDVHLGSYTIPLEIIRKRNKNIYFRFKEDGKLIVTCNNFVSEKNVKKLILENEKKLLKMYESFLKHSMEDKQFYYLGEPYTIVYDERIEKIEVSDRMIFVKNEKVFNKWYKEECVRVFSDRINVLLDKFINIPKFILKIRKMKTRWGVNNVTKRIITLNSDLLMKDVDLIDYVIVHELCHFYEANHSSRFWYQVGLRYPDYKLARKRLRG